MTTPSRPVPGTVTPSAAREHISCPGCGRHDWVTWPEGQDTYPWKCFNCEKQFELRRSGKH